MNKYDSVTKELDCLAGREAKPNPEAPEGIVIWDFPEQTYAVIQCTIKTIMDAFRHSAEWCSNKGYSRRKGPEFEFYLDGWLETGFIYMYFPMEKA